MESGGRTYICIDLKSFYASVECVERGLDPLTTNLVVADPERTEKTICLAVSPSLKAKGVPGRCRLFEVPKAYDFIIAPPRMHLYIQYSAGIYGIYLRYFSKEDIHVYSIDEAFIDVTKYLSYYHQSARELAGTVMKKIVDTYGITATCGIGPNLYLCKVALDITAKHMSPGPLGERIGTLTVQSYQETLWDHQPITDFWRVGRGTARCLQQVGILTMRQLAHADEDLLFRLFGVDAELLLDHAWGYETATISDIHHYHAEKTSIDRGQVLSQPYDFEKGELIVKEMAQTISMELMRSHLLTGHISLSVGFDREEAAFDHASKSLREATNLSVDLIPAYTELYERIVGKEETLVRRFGLSAETVKEEEVPEQLNLFEEEEGETKGSRKKGGTQAHHKKAQEAALKIQQKYGKNAMLKGMDLAEGATQKERNRQIGGHKA